MKGRVAAVALLLAVGTLGVAQPARAIPLGPLALAFGLDMIRNRASQPVESSTVGMPSLSVNVHWDDGSRDLIIGGANLGAQGLVVSAGCILEIEPALPVKPGISDLRAITLYSMRAGFPNLALVRPDFRKDLMKELGLAEEKDCEREGVRERRSPWSREPHRIRRDYSDDRRPSEISRLRDWSIVEVNDYVGWLIWLDTRELNGYYSPVVDFYFRNGTVPAGFLNLCRKARADSLRSITNIAVVRAEEIEAGMNSPGVQHALQYFGGGEFYVPPVVGGPSFRVTNPEVQAMIAESQPQPQSPPPPMAGYPQPRPGFRSPDPRPVPAFPTEGRERTVPPPAMPGGNRGDPSDYWERSVELPPPEASPEEVLPPTLDLLRPEAEQVLRREAGYTGYGGPLLRQGSYRLNWSGDCPYSREGLPLQIVVVEGGRLQVPFTVEVERVRAGERQRQAFTATKQPYKIITGLKPGDDLTIFWHGQQVWQGQMRSGQGLWVPITVDR